jgi:predicted deacylase
MACEAATIELRGEIQVYDDLAQKDAAALFRFFQRRGYIAVESGLTLSSLPALLRDATPLTAVEMVEAPIAGVIAWKVDIGDTVSAGDVLGEIVDVVNLDAPRYLLRTRTSGVVYGMRNHKLIRPGETIIKIAGSDVLPWRTGKLLTA